MFLNKYAIASSGSAPGASSSTIRTSCVDSSRTSTNCGSFLSIINPAIRSTRVALFIAYGTELTISACLPRPWSSICHSPRIRTEPRPVSYISTSSRCVLRILQPVGKSGPLIKAVNLETESSGSFESSSSALIVSFRLCGGILVAIPTAMPVAPFINRFGMRLGRTVGSTTVESKLSRKITVSSLISPITSIAIWRSRASV